ncbi:stalk domain-containing protein [Paenibacillus sp. GCM10023252]|uniref:stalk domain-containing protein n=1 Tax=Paenibacillus sp. GCM10023252 TaxID=3252649 RepID=UPI0036217809
MHGIMGISRKTWAGSIRTTYVTLALLLLVTASLAGIGSASPPAKIEINGSAVTFQTAPILEGKELYVPMDEYLDALQAVYTNDEYTSTVKIRKNGRTAQFTLGRTTALKNGVPHYLATPVSKTGGKIMIPFQFVTEALGGTVTAGSGKSVFRVSIKHLPDVPPVDPNDEPYGGGDDPVYDSVFTPKIGNWKIEDEVYTTDGTTNGSTVTREEGVLADFSFEVTVRMLSDNGDPNNWAGINFRKMNGSGYPWDDGYLLYVSATGNVVVYKAGEGPIASKPLGRNITEKDLRLKITMAGPDLNIYTDGGTDPFLSLSDSSFTEGYIGLGSTQAVVQFKDIVITENPEGPGPAHVFTPKIGEWSIENEVYTTDGVTNGSVATREESILGDFTMEATIRMTDAKGDLNNWAGFNLRKANGSALPWDDGYLVIATGTGNLLVLKAGSGVLSGKALGTSITEQDLRLKVTMVGSEMNIYVNDGAEPFLTLSDSGFTEGYVGLASTQASVQFKDIAVSNDPNGGNVEPATP